MKISEFDYQLPEELIAQTPDAVRDKSRLMVVEKNKKNLRHYSVFEKIIEIFCAGDVLVLNDTMVIPARLLGKKTTGGKVEALVISFQGKQATAMIQASKRPRSGDLYFFADYKATVIERKETGWVIEFEEVEVMQVMEEIGRPPLPPYIKRKGEFSEKNLAEDILRYQTVYAKNPGAIAAPTAGLHFTEDLLARIKQKGVEIHFVTLHVGPGTFLPVREDNIEDHVMHSEYYRISPEVANAVNKARSQDRRIIAVGTTACRTLETAGKTGTVQPGAGWSDLFIYPPYSFKIIDALVTNFHLPKSTLLMLVSALAGKELIMIAYQQAIEQKYRFFSYGDAMIII